jgi:cytochrome P450
MIATDFDPFSASVISDPYPWYAALHEGPRVLRDERWNIWVLSRHVDVRATVRDHARLSSAEGVTYVRAPLPMMLTMDPPDHERLRRIVGREFAPRDIERFRPAVDRFVTAGLDELSESGDLVEAVAVPVPIRLMAEILGVPEPDIPDLRRMADDLVKGFAIAPAGSDTVAEASVTFDFARIGQAIADIHGYFSSMIAERRARPAGDLVTKLIEPTADGVLSDDELLWFCLLLLVAGIETTTNLIGNMALALAEHPDQWEKLRERRDLIPSAVNESLRYDPPIQGFFRTTLGPIAVGDCEIPEGARVLLSFGAANRDPAHYDDPDAYRVDRDPTDHLAFGSGIHRCLGAGLAELEGRVVLEKLVDRAKTLEIAGEVVRTTNPTLRGAAVLPVHLG